MEIKVVKQILGRNEDVSKEVKETLDANNVKLINVMGSPGTGKTSVIAALIEKLKDKYRIGVIEGDIAGQIDAEKIAGMGIDVVQLNTDGACHVEAMSIKNILPHFNLEDLDFIIVENIGNLVCPAAFNLGETIRLVILSVPEGDDKIAKYPDMFMKSDVVVINKFDMKPYFDFDDERVENDAKDLNGHAGFFRVSSKTGEGFEKLSDWIADRI